MGELACFRDNVKTFEMFGISDNSTKHFDGVCLKDTTQVIKLQMRLKYGLKLMLRNYVKRKDSDGNANDRPKFQREEVAVDMDIDDTMSVRNFSHMRREKSKVNEKSDSLIKKPEVQESVETKSVKHEKVEIKQERVAETRVIPPHLPAIEELNLSAKQRLASKSNLSQKTSILNEFHRELATLPL